MTSVASMKLLVIDPDEYAPGIIRTVLRTRLVDPFEVDHESDSEQALRRIEQCRHDVCLIDHDFDSAYHGAFVEAALAVGCPPLLFLNGNRNHAAEQTALAVGAADFLWKEELSAPMLESAVRHARNVRDRMRIERQMHLGQRMETVGQLAGGIAHEFNNILTAIVGFGSLLAEHLEHDETATLQVREILGGAERARSLTRDLLAFSRRQVLRPARVNLAEVVEPLVRMLRGVLGSHIELIVRCAEGVPSIHADRAQLDQAITNLAINAREAMPNGGRLSIEVDAVTLDEAYCDTHISARPGDYVRLAVTDTGGGIPREQLPRVFEPFFTTGDSGTHAGLGLSTVYGIVKQSGGNIWVYSEPGLGTTFKLYFPVRVVNQLDVDRVVTPDPAPSRGARTILLVDDTEMVRRLTRNVLSRAGYHVLEAGGAEEALQVAGSQPAPIDLLVTDVIMPGRTGIDLADHMRTAGNHVRVLYTSGYTEMSLVREGLLAEDVVFLQKPFTPEDLLRKVRQVLEAA